MIRVAHSAVDCPLCGRWQTNAVSAPNVGIEQGTARSTRICFIIAALIVLIALPTQAAEVIPPKPPAYFNDYAGVVPQATALQLNEQLAQFERETSNQIVVAVQPNFPSQSSIEDFTQRTFQAWNVGQKGRNNGAVLFVFVNDRKMRIQTGYGLEGALPDATCYDIISNVIAPRFRRGDYAGGLSAGITAMMQAVRGEYTGSGRTVAERQAGSKTVPLLLVLLFIILMIMIARASRRRGYGFTGRGPFYVGGLGGGGRGWSGGSSGGGFSGFSGGGGSSGGGGASGSW